MFGFLPWRAFWMTCVVIAFALIVRVWGIFPLYVHAATRERVKTTLEGTAAREGWLLSDLSVLRVTDNAVLLLRRAHLRGPDAYSCHHLNTYNGSLQSCR